MSGPFRLEGEGQLLGVEPDPGGGLVPERGIQREHRPFAPIAWLCCATRALAMAVHQLLPTFRGDAADRAAVGLQVALRRLGVWGEVYAHRVARPFGALVQPAKT